MAKKKLIDKIQVILNAHQEVLNTNEYVSVFQSVLHFNVENIPEKVIREFIITKIDMVQKDVNITLDSVKKRILEA